MRDIPSARVSLGLTHFFGMLRSSTCTTNCFPAGGPKTPFLRFSTLASTMSCVMLADVCAEKVIVKGDTDESTTLKRPHHGERSKRTVEYGRPTETIAAARTRVDGALLHLSTTAMVFLLSFNSPGFFEPREPIAGVNVGYPEANDLCLGWDQGFLESRN